MVTNLVEIAASAAIRATTGWLYSVTLTGGSDAATLQIRNGGVAGTIVKTMKAAINTTVHCKLHGALFTQGIYGTLTGTGMLASFEYR